MSERPSLSEQTDESAEIQRRLPVGAELIPGCGTSFRVWAPVTQSITVVFEDGRKPFALSGDGAGYFEGAAPNVLAGTRYKYQIDGGEPFPDPASRYQPDGPHGYSQVVDPLAFKWTDDRWPGIDLHGQVIYEMHIGTFTQEGTWRAAASKLDYLKDTGVTVLEMMPVAEFPGKFGWGYDGVALYAPVSIYGSPDDMRAFVDKAHSVELAVILDVVYNHLGPDGNYLTKFSPFYLSDKHCTDWGIGINFDGNQSAGVREFFRANAAYWIRDFHLDGLRLDATQDIHDESKPNIIAEIVESARSAAGKRHIILVGENEPQNNLLLKSGAEGGSGLDALWNDDYHHTAMVAMTGKADAYYTDYKGTPQEFVSAAKYGFLFQGQWYRWQKQPRGTSTLGLNREAMINFIQNHDQVANSARGQRVHELSSPGVDRAITALTLLMPGTPMLFQGQEFASSSPFLFFADHKPELAVQVKQGRAEFLSQWRSLLSEEAKRCFDDPAARATFERSRLDHSEVKKHSEAYALHRDLLRLRKQDPVFSRQGDLDGAVLSPHCFVLRFFSPDYQEDRLLLINLGADLHLDPSPEPLLGPPAGNQWEKVWSSDDAAYGGCGVASFDPDENWIAPGQAAVVLAPIPIRNPSKLKIRNRIKK